MDEQPTPIAAFDFDCTITSRDTLIPFLLFIVGPLRLISGAFFLLPTFFAYMFGRCDRHSLKERTFTCYLSGMDMLEFQQQATRFSRLKIPDMIRPKALERIEWHKNEGHRLIVVSAALGYYLDDWAETNGFEVVVASILATENGKITGQLSGANCRRQEKVRRLMEYLEKGEKKFILYAYGDSIGDKELLEFADHSFYRYF